MTDEEILRIIVFKTSFMRRAKLIRYANKHNISKVEAMRKFIEFKRKK